VATPARNRLYTVPAANTLQPLCERREPTIVGSGGQRVKLYCIKRLISCVYNSTNVPEALTARLMGGPTVPCNALRRFRERKFGCVCLKVWRKCALVASSVWGFWPPIINPALHNRLSWHYYQGWERRGSRSPHAVWDRLEFQNMLSLLESSQQTEK